MIDFAFIVHPLEISNIYNWQPWTRLFPESIIKFALKHLPPIEASTIKVDHEKIKLEGVIIVCPLLTTQLLEIDQKKVINKIIDSAKVGAKKGAKVIGLGAYTSVVGDKGVTISKNVRTLFTTGNSLTVATIIDSCRLVSERNKHFNNSKITIIGATGSIGSACSRILAKEASLLNLCAPNDKKLTNLIKTIDKPNIKIIKFIDPKRAVQEADITILASSNPKKILNISDFKQKSIICDVSTPANVYKDRNYDVYYFKGGLLNFPSYVKFDENKLGLKKGLIYSCLAETIILSLEKYKQHYSIGSDLSISNIENIQTLAKKYGFSPYINFI